MRINAFSVRGFGLLEVLITLIVVAIGLLGIAALQVRAQQSELEAYQRAQALILLQDMVERIKANRRAAGCYAVSDGGIVLGADYEQTYSCIGFGDAASRARAEADIAQWSELLQGAAEVLDHNKVGAMHGARGCIRAGPAVNEYSVAIAWQGVRATAVPTGADTCGSGLYGQDLRRVVEARLTIVGLQ